jgi:tryptophan-rich sensory protein
MGLAIAVVIHARGSRRRGVAILVFVVQLALNLIWSPVFFGMHRIGTATLIIAAMLVAAIATTVLFGRIRTLAAWLMVPYLVWISFAGVLCWQIGRLNPDAQGIAPSAGSTQVIDL